MAWYYLLTLLLGGILGWWLKRWQWQRQFPDLNRAALRERVFAGQVRTQADVPAPILTPDTSGITGKPEQIAQALADSVDTVERLELQVRELEDSLDEARRYRKSVQSDTSPAPASATASPPDDALQTLRRQLADAEDKLARQASGIEAMQALEQRLGDRNAELHALHTTIDTLKQENTAYQQSIADLRRQEDALKAAHHNDVHEAQADNLALQQSLAGLQETLQQRDRQLAHLASVQSQLSDVRHAAEGLSIKAARAEELERELAHTRHCLQEREHALGEARQSIEALTGKLDAQEDAHRLQSQQQDEAHRSALDQALDTHAVELAAREQHYAEQLDTLQQTAADRLAAQARAEAQRAESREAQFTREREHLTALTVRLRNEIDSLCADNQRLHTALDAAAASAQGQGLVIEENQRLKGQLMRVQSLENAVRKRDERIAAHQREIAHLQRRAQDADEFEQTLNRRDAELAAAQLEAAALADMQAQLAGQAAQNADLLQRLAALRSVEHELVDTRQALAAQVDRGEELDRVRTERDELRECERQLQERLKQLSEHTAELETRLEAATTQQQRADAAEQALTSQRERTAGLEANLVDLHRQQARWQTTHQEATRLREENRRQAEEIAAAQALLDEVDRQAHNTNPELQRLRAEVQSLRRQLTLQGERKPVSAPAIPVVQRLFEPPEDQDDLKLIHGIGPRIEDLLNAMGITTFRQIAAFSAEDVTRVAAQLPAFPGRIERDDWIGKARALAASGSETALVDE